MRLLPSIFLLASLTFMPQAADLHPTLIIHHAKVRTLEKALPLAQAVAIYRDRIVSVGDNNQILKTAGQGTRVIDANGALLLPGFNDAHLHFLTGGFQLSRVDLRDAKSPAEFASRIARFKPKVPKGSWILGGQWDHENWPGTPLPTRQMIDAVCADVPVFVSRLDGHMAVANSLGLRLAGINANTPVPDGGAIVMDNGEPTGLLKDAAMDLVWKVVPQASFEEKLAAAKAASDHAASFGVTSVQDMSTANDLAVLHELHRRGELKTRVYGMFPLRRWKDLADVGIRQGFGNMMIRTGGLKAFSDGSLGSSTALFFEPYAGSLTNFGLPADEMFPDGTMLGRIKDADAAGLQVMIHAIGDKANHLVLSMFEQVSASNGSRERRFRIEHAQHLRPADIPRFAKGGVIASMQPYHAADDGRWAEKRIGPERIKTTYAFRSLLDSGVTLAFGSDWAVAPLDPLLGIEAAVTRQTLDGKNPHGWIPAEKISVQEAVEAYTLGSAKAEFMEANKGSIKEGKLADLVLLDKNIFEITPSEIHTAKVLLTICNGQLAYEKK